jgi:type VI secretion system protein
LLSGCVTSRSAGPWLGPQHENRLKALQVVASADANAGLATAIDIVWVFSPNPLAQMPKTGPQWFAAKDPLLAGYSTDLAVMSLAVPAGGDVPSLALPEHHSKAVAVLAYVNFLQPAGQAVATLTPFVCVRIELAAASVSYSSCQP